MSKSSRPVQVDGAPLLERSGETAALRAAIERALQGSGGLVVVEGPAGIGKTRLIREAAGMGEQAGLLVRSARGGEMERDLPFGIARQLFEPLIARASEQDKESLLSGNAQQAMGALGNLDRDASVPLDSFAPINGLYWLAANLAEKQATLLMVDDAHWADVTSLRFIDFLARRVSHLSLLVILGIRTGEPSEPEELAPLRLEAERLQPQPLGPRSVHELISATVGREPTERFAATCVSATRGNPFLVSEILRELRSEGLEVDDTAATSISKMAPENVAASVLIRLSRFGDEAIALTHAIAILGRAPQMRHAAELAGMQEAQARRLCDQLRDAEILAPGVPIDFVHPLVRQAIYHELPEGERSAAHRKAAGLLDATGAGPLAVALHLLECAPNGDQWVASKLQEAAREAIHRGAFGSAVTFLDRALLEPPDDELRVLSRLGAALIDTDPYRASDVLSEVAERTEDAGIRAYALRFSIAANQNVARLPEAASACGRLLDLVGDASPELVLALEAQRHVLRRWDERVDDATVTRFDSLVESVDGETTGGRLLRQAAAWDRFCRCAPVDDVVDLALPFAEPPWVIAGLPSTVPAFAVLALAWSGRWMDARTAALQWREAIEDAESGWTSALSMANACLSIAERLSGRLHEAEANARSAWEMTRTLAPTSAFGWVTFTALAAALLARGEIQTFEDLTAGVEMSLGAEWAPGGWPLEVRAYGHLARGELGDAVEDLLSLGHGLERFGWVNPAYPPWRQEATDALARLGRTREAGELISIAEERARVFQAPHVIGTVLRARATIEPNNRAIDTLGASVALLERSGPPHELARSLVDLGSALHRAGCRNEAREPLRRAVELAHRSGAGALEKRAMEELVATGSRPRRLAATGLDALTATEGRVARLAADGLTNREIAERLFVTTRTIETHLTHIYEKLSIAGRRQLAGALTTSAERPDS